MNQDCACIEDFSILLAVRVITRLLCQNALRCSELHECPVREHAEETLNEQAS